MQAVVWHDGAAWRAALDTSDLHPEPGPGGAPRAGALAAAAPMTNFRAERQYGTFSAEDACNYALNIYDAGAVLSIVVDADPHGTHVAGIAAACHPDAPELNGAAPGAAAPCRACTGHVRAASRVREGCEQGWRQLPDMRTPRCDCCGDVASFLLSGEAGGCECAVAGLLSRSICRECAQPGARAGRRRTDHLVQDWRLAPGQHGDRHGAHARFDRRASGPRGPGQHELW